MKKVFYNNVMLLTAVALFCGCQFSDDEYDKPEPVQSLEADMEALKKGSSDISSDTAIMQSV